MSVIVQDTFTDTDGTGLASHTPDVDTVGAGWSVLSSTPVILSNRLDPAEGQAMIDSGIADGIVRADVYGRQNGGAVGPAFRVQDASNMWFAVIIFGATDNFYIFQRSGGSNTVRASTVVTVDLLTYYTIEVTLDGSSITATLDGGNEISFSSATLATETRHGYWNSSGGAYIDNFIVDDGVTNSVTITSPTQYLTRQRSAGGAASLSVTGTYAGSPTAIEYQVDSGTWATLDNAPTGGAFSGTIASIAAGEHTVGVRFSNDTGTTHTVTNVRVGDVFGWIGQSNQVGRLTNGQTYGSATPSSSYDEGGSWRNLTTNYRQSDENMGYSVLPLLASLIATDQAVPVAFIDIGDGGTTLAAAPFHWAAGGSMYAAFIAAVAASGCGDLKAILWYQGEQDVSADTSQANYTTGEAAMLDAMQAAMSVSSPLISANLGELIAYTATQIDAVRLAKLANWDNDTDIHAGPTGHDQDFVDGLHWTTDAEAARLAGRWWRCIDAALYGGAESGRGPQFSSATRTGTTIVVTFTGGEGSLVNADDPTGFAFTDDGSPISISSSAANGSTAIDLTLASEPSGTELLSFASGNSAAGATLVDSGTYPLPPEPFIGGVVVTASPQMYTLSALANPSPTLDTLANPSPAQNALANPSPAQEVLVG